MSVRKRLSLVENQEEASKNSNQGSTVVDLTRTGKPLPQKQTSIVNFFKKKSSNCSGNMSVDFAQSSSQSSPGLLNDSGIPPSHIINPDGDDRALEYELERSRDAIQNISLFSSQEPTC